jgi:hypothetical protein
MKVQSLSEGVHIRITQNVDRELGRLVSEFLNGATRSFKDRMQQTARALGVEIGFLHQKQVKFEQGLADLEKTDPALADYLREARRWGDSLVTTRTTSTMAIGVFHVLPSLTSAVVSS